MLFRRSDLSSAANYQEQIRRLKKELETADAVIIGAGAGLSAAAGMQYTGTRFKEYFEDFYEKYRYTDMYSGGFYPYDTPEEHWAYWSRYIFINRYMDAPEPVYQELNDLVKDKDYFVLTTNVDHCFQKAGFDRQRLFYTQGDYVLSPNRCRKTARWRAAACQEISMEFLRTAPAGAGQAVTCSTSGMGLRLK